jgi:competence protein ComEA
VNTFPVTRGQALAIAALIVAALVVAGRWFSSDAPPEPQAPALALERTAPEKRPALVVHVVGAVRRPGLYRLADGSRIADALERAGGATVRAELALVNLAAPVADGTQVIVPARQSVGRGAAPSADPPVALGGPVHLNTATLEQLDALPGVGPATAQRILDYRQEHGAFRSVDELDAVPGIGPARLEQLRELVTP